MLQELQTADERKFLNELESINIKISKVLNKRSLLNIGIFIF